MPEVLPEQETKNAHSKNFIDVLPCYSQQQKKSYFVSTILVQKKDIDCEAALSSSLYKSHSAHINVFCPAGVVCFSVCQDH